MGRNETEPGELTPKQEKALSALLSEPTTEAAAKAAGCSRAALFRWLAEPAFAEAYRQARGRLLEGALVALQSASGAAVETLREIAADGNAPASVRVSASKAILDAALKGRETIEIDERLKALETLLAPKAQG